MTPEEFMSRMRSGEFDWQEIGRGMHKAFCNAESLLEDAEYFLKHKPGRAISLAVLAAEEIAKVFLLAEVVLMAAAHPVPWDEAERSMKLRAHKAKLEVFAQYGDRILNRFFAEEGTTYYKESLPVGIAPLLDYFKQLGLYVNPAEDRFISPEEFGRDNPELAETLVTAARERLESIRKMHSSEKQSIAMAGILVELLKEYARTMVASGDVDAAAMREIVKKGMAVARTAMEEGDSGTASPQDESQHG
ncbi:MAG: AbiV family abortive infection protein [Candidatus Latescibacteria bacterium]|nr:AbiV family abortive infection protein [Candidatus Latescibacterota bacterium]